MPGLNYSVNICFKPVGVVEEGLERPGGYRASKSRYEVISTIRVFDEFVEGLEGLDEYSHIIVVYWMHEEREVRLRVRPWGVEGYPEVGIFATRFPPRPNPIGVAVAELVSLEESRVRVRGLDAWTGTPVLDLKPYDYYDIVKNPRVPWWFRDRWERWKLRWDYVKIAPWLGPCV